jgi:ABC-type phosphate transport system substrate-binding protein
VFKKAVAGVLVSFALNASVFADVAVIVNPSNTSLLTESAIERIFLGKSTQFPDGSVAIPLNTTGEVYDTFNERVLGRSSSQIQSYWAKLVFTGRGTPPKEVDEASIIELIKDNKNAIAYIHSSCVTDDVKVVLVK